MRRGPRSRSQTTIRLSAHPAIRLLSLLTSLALASCAHDPASSRATDPPASPASTPLVFEDVNLIGMVTDGVQEHQTVVVENGRIIAIGPPGPGTPRPAGAVVIDARDRYLMPALIDMHVHIRTADLPAYLAAGITTVRNMWGYVGLQTLAASIESGATAGPRIISASPGLDDEPVSWPQTRIVRDSADGVAAVAEEVAAHWSYLKVYSRLSPAAFRSIMREAREQGMTVVGHVPFAVPVDEAMALGQRSIEHLTGYDRAVSRAGRVGTGGWIDADPARYPALVDLTVRSEVWNCPTLAIYVALSQQSSVSDRDAIVTQRRRFVRELDRAGALLLAGSDAGIDVVAPGQSLHDELREMVAAGLSPYRALRAATADAGRFLAIEGVGTVTVGAPADLLLVPRNPLDDVGRVREFDGMVRRGAWSPRP